MYDLSPHTKQRLEKCIKLQLPDHQIAKRLGMCRSRVNSCVRHFWPELPLTSAGRGSVKSLRKHMGFPAIVVSPAEQKRRKRHGHVIALAASGWWREHKAYIAKLEARVKELEAKYEKA